MTNARKLSGKADKQLHFAVITSPVIGHFKPLSALADELRSRGCRVTFVHVAEAKDLVKDHPPDFCAIGSGGEGSLRRYHALLGRASGLVGTWRMVRATARLCNQLCQEAPSAVRDIGADVVLADVAEPAGALVARRLGLTFVGVIVGLPLHSDPIVPPPFLGWQVDTSPRGLTLVSRAYRVTAVMMRPITRVLRRHARKHGLNEDPTQVLSPLLNIAQCPPQLDFARSLPEPPIAWCGPFRRRTTEKLELPRDGRPLVFCSLGTLQSGRLAIVRSMAEACHDAGARAVIAHCGLLSDALVQSLPGDPIVRDFWPQEIVLKQVDAAILHGGFNTVIDALSAGVPMVVVPIAFEQPGTAARLQAAGAAIVIPRRQLTHVRLRTALQQVLTQPAFTQAAKRFADRMCSDGAARAADAIVGACRDLSSTSDRSSA